MVRERGDEHRADRLAIAVVPSQDFIPSQSGEEPIGGCPVLIGEHRRKVRCVPSPAWSSSAPKVFITPNRGLEAHIYLSDVMQGCEDGQTRCGCVVDTVLIPGAGQPVPDGLLGQQRLEAGANIGQVVLEQVNALWPPFAVRVRLGPE